MMPARYCIAGFFLFLFLWATAARAADVSVIGLFPGKAVVTINGGTPRTLSVGQKTPEGVTLISSDRETALLDIAGKKATLRLGQHLPGARAATGQQSVTLTADTRGHFVVDGQVNGAAVRFLLDTGATFIALPMEEANRLGIDYRKGQLVRVSTANGQARAYRVKLDSVRVGDITLNSVDALVQDGGGLPFALLGMSFLNRMEMRREGQTMVLIRRF